MSGDEVHVFVADTDNGRIQVFNLDGSYIHNYVESVFRCLCGLSIHEDS